jgi:hypothetical protein
MMSVKVGQKMKDRIMIYDITNLFSDGQAITGDARSTNTIDLGATGTPFGASAALVRDIGKGSRVPLSVIVSQTFNNLTSLTISLQVDDNDAFSSAKTVAQIVVPAADLVVGRQLPFPDYVPEGTNERHLSLYYDVTGTNPSTGALTAGIVAARQTNFVGGQ